MTGPAHSKRQHDWTPLYNTPRRILRNIFRSAEFVRVVCCCVGFSSRVTGLSCVECRDILQAAPNSSYSRSRVRIGDGRRHTTSTSADCRPFREELPEENPARERQQSLLEAEYATTRVHAGDTVDGVIAYVTHGPRQIDS